LSNYQTGGYNLQGRNGTVGAELDQPSVYNALTKMHSSMTTHHDGIRPAGHSK